MTELIITSSILISVIILLRYFLRGKISLRLQYALWLIVLLRLLVPVTWVDSSFSVMNAVAPVTERGSYVASAVLGYIGYTIPDLAVAEPDPDASIVDQEKQYAENRAQWKAEIDHAKAETGTPVTVSGVLNTIWLAGISVVGFCLLLSNLIFGRRLRQTRKKYRADNYRLPVYEVEELLSPCLFGVFRPAIYITPDVAGDKTKLRHVLAHELTHYRHGDHIWSVLRCLCLAIHWYNPLVWLAATLSRRDAELACDESTIKSIGEANRTEYGHTLIGLTCGKCRAADLLYCATTMTDDKNGIKERVTLIAKKPKTSFCAFAIVMLVAVGAVGCTFTGANLNDGAAGIDDKMSADDPYFGVSATDPAETVKRFLEAEKEQDYTIILEIHQVAVSESDRVQVVERFKGSDYAKSKNWTDEYVENNITAVAAYYSVLYDHGKIFYDDGEIVRRFYLKCENQTGLWTIWDNDGGIGLNAFINGKMKWPDCLAKPEGVDLGIVMDGINVPDNVLASAKALVAGHFERAHVDHADYKYVNWRIESLEQAYTYDDLDGLVLDIFRMNYEFLSAAPENVMPAGGMYIKEDGWVCPTYPNCTYLIFSADDGFFFRAIMINDGYPGDELFTSDLRNLRLSEAALRAAGVGEAVATADIDRDCGNEKFYLDTTQMGSNMDRVALRIYNDRGYGIWSEYAYLAHTGWDSLFLCELNGEPYILRYNPGMFQGYCDYTYTLFTLEGGAETVHQTNTIEFDINGTKAFDVPGMVAFADGINVLLEKSTLLLSSKDGLFTFGPVSPTPFFETYSWLNERPELNLYTEGDDLAARLQKYSDYAVANRALP